MKNIDEIEVLKSEVAILKTEVNDLKEFIKAMYCMISDDEEYDSSSELMPGNMISRFNT